jgi:negative regulator of sigma E activity
VSDDRHDEIAARLREEGAARAPERLRADVMLQVRAEPRPRRIRPVRRGYWRPLGSLAAAACLLAALVLGVNRMEAGSGSGAAGTEAASAGAARALTLPSRAPVPKAIAPGADGAASGRIHKEVEGRAVTGRFNNELEAAPVPLRYTYTLRLGLLAPMREAFSPLEPRQGRGTHTP